MTDTAIIVVDGPDGAGKTTLVGTLLSTYQRTQAVSVAPRLGKFLPCGDDDESFASWVTTHSTSEVNSTMMAASAGRMKATANLARSSIVLVDRGPVTVFASCVARVMQRDGVSAKEAEGLVSPLVEQYRPYPVANNVLHLVLCYIPQIEVILQRCADDTIDPEYRKYLIALHSVLRPSWALLQGHLVLPANTSPSDNARRVIQATR